MGMNDPSGKTQSLASDPNRTQLGGAPSADPNRTVMGTAPTLNATQTIKPTQCPVCKTFNPAGVMFCIECGLIFDKALPDDAFGAPAVQLPVLVDGSGREHPIRPGANVLGREGDIVVADARASRRHAQIVSEDGVLNLEDLGSTNGTLVNGEKLEPGVQRTLENGDKVSLGGVELALSQPGKAAATAAIPSNKTASLPTAPRASTAVATLVGDGVEYPLEPGENTFGRKSENAIAIADPYVSGRHGIIEVAEDGIYVTDTGSTNGTMLNEAKLAPNMRTAITEADVIRLGSLEFRVRRHS